MQSADMNFYTSKDFQKMMESEGVDFGKEAKMVEKKTTNLPSGMRTPTAEELEDIAAFAAKYRKQHPKASERNLRRAAQRKFNVQILPNTI